MLRLSPFLCRLHVFHLPGTVPVHVVHLQRSSRDQRGAVAVTDDASDSQHARLTPGVTSMLPAVGNTPLCSMQRWRAVVRQTRLQTGRVAHALHQIPSAGTSPDHCDGCTQSRHRFLEGNDMYESVQDATHVLAA